VKQEQLFPDSAPMRIAIVLGAGASRGVSYSDRGGIQSPLDSDFFDLLQRLEPAKQDARAVQSVITEVQALPYECWRSMERAFYTLHLRAYMLAKLEEDEDEVDEDADKDVIRDFARCIQAVLRKAHGKQICDHHRRLWAPLCATDTILSFNYDLVAERAIRQKAEKQKAAFGRWIYGLVASGRSDLPPILKLHGSSNWRLIASAKPGGPEKIEVATADWATLDVGPGYQAHIGEGAAFPIFLPFWEKRIEQGPWLQIWRKAYSRLKLAQAVVVWGYSLPATDIKAQHVFNLTLGGKALKLCVVDPSPETRRRWRELLPGAKFFPYESIEHFFSAPPPWWRQREESPIITA
jgi:hypothetical protein